MKNTYTQHGLKTNWLKALARAKNLVDAGKTGTAYSNGLGHGSASIRLALRNRGLIDDDDVITDAGIAAVMEARNEGW